MKKYYHPIYKNYYATKSCEVYNKNRDQPVKGTIVNGYLKFSIFQKGSKPIKYPIDKFVWEAINGEEWIFT